jgi:glutaredoxin
VDFVEVFLEDNPEAEGVVLRVNNGRRKVPTIQVGDRFFACSPFNAARLASELNIPLNR